MGRIQWVLESVENLLEYLEQEYPTTDAAAYLVRELAEKLAECRNIATALAADEKKGK